MEKPAPAVTAKILGDFVERAGRKLRHQADIVVVQRDKSDLSAARAAESVQHLAALQDRAGV